MRTSYYGSYWSNWKVNSLGQIASKSPTWTTYLQTVGHSLFALLTTTITTTTWACNLQLPTTSSTELSPWTEAPGSYSQTFVFVCCFLTSLALLLSAYRLYKSITIFHIHNSIFYIYINNTLNWWAMLLDWSAWCGRCILHWFACFTIFIFPGICPQ